MIGVVAALGFLAGAGLPWLIARIPDRAAGEGETAPASYREIAAGRWVWLVLAVITAVVWGLLTLARSASPAELPAFLLVGALGVAMSHVDLRAHRLPDLLTGPAFVGAVVLLTVAAATAGEWGALLRAVAAAAATTAFYLLLVLIRPADMGLGDVKLAASIGLLLGWVGWSAVVVGTFLAFLLGGLAGIVLMILGRAGRRSAIPFGPSMLAGALLAVMWTRPVVEAYLGR